MKPSPRGKNTDTLLKSFPGDPGKDAEGAEERLLRVARMFSQHRDSDLMRELCLLAVKCAREGLVRA
jgi:hypothetical protein